MGSEEAVPICADIAAGKIDPEGEIILDDPGKGAHVPSEHPR